LRSVTAGISSYSLKFHRLTIAISASGIKKNSKKTSANGRRLPPCLHGMDGRAGRVRAGGRGAHRVKRRRTRSTCEPCIRSRPSRRSSRRCRPCAARSCRRRARAGLGQQVAVRALDVLAWRLAFHPVGPLVGFHLGLGRVEHRAVVALAVEVGAGPAVEEPVDELIGAVELLARERGRQAEAGRPRRDSLPSAAGSCRRCPWCARP
jgi:hypothetical protein